MLESNLKRVGRGIQEFRRIIVSDDLHIVVEAVLRGDGVSFMSRDVLAGYIEAGRVKAHHVPGFRHARSRALVLAQAGGTGGPLGRFVATLFDHFSLPVPGELGGAEGSAEPVAARGPECRAGCEPLPATLRRRTSTTVRTARPRRAGRRAAR
jgi:hypothetical protein